MGKFKWALLGVMAVCNNEIISWIVLIVLAASFILPIMKEAAKNV